MKLLLRGHDDRYAVEQLQLALFPEEPMEPVTEPFSGDGAVSSLHTGAVWLTATAEITLHGKTGRACRHLRAAEADVPARRRLLQNAEKLSDGLRDAAACLDGGDEAQGAAALLTQAERDLAHSARFDESLQPLHDTIADLMYQAQDAAEQLRDRLYRLSYSADELEQLEERLDLLREADAIAREELSKAGLDRDIWQCPVVLLADVHSVGVQGDERTYGSPIVLRPVSSEDAMTADWSRVPYDVLATISTRITNECRQINRVVLDCTSKPPATIEWE